MSEVRTVAVLGTGIMGGPMARNIANAGFDVRVWNRTEEKARAVAESADSAQLAHTPVEAVEGADAVVTMLFDGHSVESVMREAIDTLGDDATWLQMSTVGIEATERLAALAEEHHTTYVDAPVLGTKQPAEEGQLTVLASGPDDALRRARPVFDVVAAKVVELGPAGAGTRAKLMMNHWVVGTVELIAETMALGQALSLDPKLFLDIIRGGPLDSAYAQAKGKAVLERQFAPSFALNNALKDTRLILAAAERHDFDAAIARTVEAKFEAASEAGHGDEDMIATWYASAGERAAAR
jgi:3-hydroxyisobutyrate dehydrogenase